MPGVSWDNLRNTETGIVASFTYTQCQVTYDRKYLLPDNTFSIPQKSSAVEQNAEIIEHWDSYTSTTAHSVNTGFDFLGKIGGKFSAEYKRVKSSQYRDESITAKIELRHRFYTIIQNPGSELHTGFKKRLLEIASFLKSNDTSTANYLAEILIRDYGTHYLSSVDAGAVLVQEDNIHTIDKSQGSQKNKEIASSAGVDFFQRLSLTAGTSHSSSEDKLKIYRHNRTSSMTFSYGGPPYRLGMSAAEWENDLENNLVAIDRSGKPLFTLVSSLTMNPNMIDPNDIQELRLLLQDVTARYYGYNTHIGCTDPNAPNFDYQANALAPGSCKTPSANYTFGGIFQQCTSSNGNSLCGELVQKNPLTGSYTCPSDFEAVLLFNGEATKSRVDVSCKNKRKCSVFIFCKTVTECTHTPITEVARYETYWCVPVRKNLNRGYLFGGLYSNDLKNPITRSQTCPSRYQALKFASHAKVCVSEDYELGQAFSLPFGGFFSCKAGNLLATKNVSEFLDNPSNWPQRCPSGFTQHLAMIEQNCRINFCVKAGSLLKHSDLDIVLPPFEPKPTVRENSTGHLFDSISYGNPVSSQNVLPIVSLLRDNTNVAYQSENPSSVASFFGHLLMIASLVAVTCGLFGSGGVL